MAEADTEKKAKQPSRSKNVVNNSQRVEVAESLIGKASSGVIHDTFKTKFGSGKFGFILIGEGDFDRDTAPRIYFNFTEFSDATFAVPRKGYGVNFTVSKDEEGRLAASDVTLTEAGKVTATAREESIANSPAPEGGVKTRAPRKPKAVDPREVVLKLSFNGQDKEITAKMSETLGKLKHNCITAMETENIALQVYHSNGTLLTKEILGSMVAGDSIMLKEKEV